MKLLKLKQNEIMGAFLNSQILSVVGLVIMLTLGSSSFAQQFSSKDSISQKSSQWIPEEHDVPAGDKILELYEGSR